MSWPRLSETLPAVQSLDVCQRCGATEPKTGHMPFVRLVEAWQEHDDDDQPEPIYVALCKACADEIIEPHPRLYRKVAAGAPCPGAMPVCVRCPHRAGLRCTHADLKANGGAGLRLSYPPPSVVIVCSRGHGCRRDTVYTGPVTCAAFDEYARSIEGGEVKDV